MIICVLAPGGGELKHTFKNVLPIALVTISLAYYDMMTDLYMAYRFRFDIEGLDGPHPAWSNMALFFMVGPTFFQSYMDWGGAKEGFFMSDEFNTPEFGNQTGALGRSWDRKALSTKLLSTFFNITGLRLLVEGMYGLYVGRLGPEFTDSKTWEGVMESPQQALMLTYYQLYRWTIGQSTDSVLVLSLVGSFASIASGEVSFLLKGGGYATFQSDQFQGYKTHVKDDEIRLRITAKDKIGMILFLTVDTMINISTFAYFVVSLPGAAKALGLVALFVRYKCDRKGREAHDNKDRDMYKRAHISSVFRLVCAAPITVDPEGYIQTDDELPRRYVLFSFTLSSSFAAVTTVIGTLSQFFYHGNLVLSFLILPYLAVLVVLNFLIFSTLWLPLIAPKKTRKVVDDVISKSRAVNAFSTAAAAPATVD